MPQVYSPAGQEIPLDVPWVSVFDQEKLKSKLALSTDSGRSIPKDIPSVMVTP